MLGSQPVFFKAAVAPVAGDGLGYTVSVGAGNTHTLPLTGTGSYNFTVDWGDGSSDTITANTDPEITHTYVAGGSYDIVINGLCTEFRFDGLGDRTQVTAINSFDAPALSMTTMTDMWQGCTNLTSVTLNNTTGVTSMRYAFAGTAIATSNGANWVTSSVTDITHMFSSGTHTQPVDTSGWDTSGLTSIVTPWFGCFSMTGAPDVSGWDTSNCTSINGVWLGCQGMTGTPDVSGWDVSNCTLIGAVFSQCYVMTATPDVSSWDTSSATELSQIFGDCRALTTAPDVSGWNTTSTFRISETFDGCWNMATTPDVSGWDTSGCTDLHGNFASCRSLATVPDVSGWNTALNRDFEDMFFDCDDFTSTPDISGWDTANGQRFDNMYRGCSAAATPDLTQFDWDDARELNNTLTVFGTGPVFSNAEVDAWLIKLEADNINPNNLTFDYDSMVGNVHLDAGRSGAANTAVSNLIAGGAVRVGTY